MDAVQAALSGERQLSTDAAADLLAAMASLQGADSGALLQVGQGRGPTDTAANAGAQVVGGMASWASCFSAWRATHRWPRWQLNKEKGRDVVAACTARTRALGKQSAEGLASQV